MSFPRIFTESSTNFPENDSSRNVDAATCQFFLCIADQITVLDGYDFQFLPEHIALFPNLKRLVMRENPNLFMRTSRKHNITLRIFVAAELFRDHPKIEQISYAPDATLTREGDVMTSSLDGAKLSIEKVTAEAREYKDATFLYKKEMAEGELEGLILPVDILFIIGEILAFELNFRALGNTVSVYLTPVNFDMYLTHKYQISEMN